MGDILVYGIGNPGRQDDSLGIRFISMIENFIKETHMNIDTESNYQLNIEDATVISNYKIVVFVDSSKENIEHFSITQVIPAKSYDLMTHSVKPEVILLLSHELFKNSPAVFLIHIKGYEWEFNEPVSANALKNLNLALKIFKNVLRNSGSIDDMIKNLAKIASRP